MPSGRSGSEKAQYAGPKRRSRRDALSHLWLSLCSGEATGFSATFARWCLALVSAFYGAIVRLRRFLYRSQIWEPARAPIPVISVGNLTVGGTGKTPCVEMIAQFLSDEGWQVGILSRGYGSASGVNDEALVLEENLPNVPHLQGPNRSELLQIAIEELEREVIVLDDGFQHRRLQRHLDVVLLDAVNPWGYGWLLPRGLLREPRSFLRDADVIVVTKSDQVSEGAIAELLTSIRRIAPAVPVCLAIHEPVGWVNAFGEWRPVDSWTDRPAAAFCGVGNPSSFRKSLEALSVSILQWKTFPDHHDYSRSDLEKLDAWAANLPDDGIVLTTQKDLVKLHISEIGDRPLWALRIAFRVVHGQETLVELLRSVMKR